MNKSPDYHCLQCGRPARVRWEDGVFHGLIRIHHPGFVCEHCHGNAPVDLCTTYAPETSSEPELLFRVTVLSLDFQLAEQVVFRGPFELPVERALKFYCGLFSSEPGIYDISAVRMREEGHPKKAFAILEEGLRRFPSSGQLITEEAAMLGMDGKPRKGLKLLESLDTDRPPLYFTVLGNLYRKQDRWEEAAKAWEEGIRACPDHKIAWTNLGFFLHNVKEDFCQAEAHYRKAAAQFPADAIFACLLANALYEQGRFLEALTAYRHAQSLSENHESAVSGEDREYMADQIALCLQHAGLAESEEKRQLEAGFVEDGSQDRKWVPVVDAPELIELLEQGDAMFFSEPERAIESYDRAIAVDASCYEAWQHKGEALRALNRLEEALACYEQALKIEPASPIAQGRRQDLLKRLGRA